MTASGVEVASSGLRIDGEEHPLLSGEVHPWRVDPDSWEPVLDAMANVGVGFVSAYVPWSVHEVARGRFDFGSPHLDVPRFLRLVSERGLKAIVRPGPDCASELPDSGWPKRILNDDRCRARRPDGRPYVLLTATAPAFPPSYASKVFLDEVEIWYRGFCEVMAPLQYPDGPIVACQVDNEIGYHFQPNTFALDYHPDSIAGFQGFLEQTYGGIGELNEAYGYSYKSFEEVSPPVDGADEPEVRRVDWVEWREVHLREALTTLAGMLRSAGMDKVPFIHNDYPRMATPLDPAALEAEAGIAIAAGDIYTTKEGGPWLREFVRYLAGTSRFPVLLELGAGWLTLPWLFPARLDRSDQEIVSLRSFFGGIRGANVYMMVERDRWYGSPISVRGHQRKESAEFLRELFDLVRSSGLLGMKRWAPVLLLENRNENRRVAARETLGAASPSAVPLFPVDRRLMEIPHPDTEVLRQWESGLSKVLNEAGVDHDRAVSVSAGDLKRYEVVVMPCLHSIDPRLWGRLVEAARSGVKVVVGPRLPTVDQHLRPSNFDQGPIELINDFRNLSEFLPEPPFRRGVATVDLHAWRGDRDEEILAAFNSTGEEVTTSLEFSGSPHFEGIWRTPSFEGEGRAEVTIGPWGFGIWKVQR